MRVVPAVTLATVAREWGRIGVLGFGGPPAHVALLRDLTVDRRRWIDAREFEDAFAACSLLPGPASTQMAIYTAQRVAGRAGARSSAGSAFILPGLVADPRDRGAWRSATSRRRPSRGSARARRRRSSRSSSRPGIKLIDPRRGPSSTSSPARSARRWPARTWSAILLLAGLVELGRHKLQVTVWPALVWLAVKVGALSFGGGYVIIPLMYGDAVEAQRWMSAQEFANAVAYGQITPGPVTHTVALVGYAAAGLGGALVATAVAFAPSFAMVMLGARHFERLRTSGNARAFLDGAGPAAAGAILGAALPLAQAIEDTWQWIVRGRRRGRARACASPPIYALIGGALVGVATTL